MTGATNGVGLGTARGLARAGVHVIMAVRNPTLGAQRAAKIGGSTEAVRLDLPDLESVHGFPARLDGDVDILINNAGALTDRRRETVDGFEATMGAYAASKLAVMLWGLELDRRLRAASSEIVSHLVHPRRVASNLTHTGDTPLMALAHKAVKTVADRFANDVDRGAAPTLYCISEPIPPGSYVGVDSRLGLRGEPTLIGRSPAAATTRLPRGW